MSFLKRAFYSMKHSWVKNLFVIIMFTVLFACCVGFLVVYSTSSKQLETVRESTACAVTLKTHLFQKKAINATTFCKLSGEDIDHFLDDPSVVAYNTPDHLSVDLEDVDALYEPQQDPAMGKAEVYDAVIYMPSYSEKDKAFTVYGYALVEGRHFTPEDDPQVCLVSREFAQHNGLKVGSRFSVHYAHPSGIESKNGPSITLQVIGIFKTKESKYLRGWASREEEMIFAPASLANTMRSAKDAAEDTRSVFSVTAYLKSEEDIPSFIERTKEKFTIDQVREGTLAYLNREPVPEEYESMSFDEFSGRLQEEPFYYIQLNQEWYNMTMGPTEKMNQLAGGMTLAFLVASALILVLVNTVLLKNKRRELGMLCAMGESKIKVALQAAIEMFVPIIIAMLLGFAIGIATGVPLAEDLTAGVYEQNAADVQGSNDLITYARTEQSEHSFNKLQAAAYTDLIFDLLPSVVVPPQPKAQVDGAAVGAYFAAVLALALVAVLIQAGAVLRLKPAKILTGKG